MTSSAKTLRALERAAMLWYKHFSGGTWFPNATVTSAKTSKLAAHVLLEQACAAHASALKRKRTGRG